MHLLRPLLLLACACAAVGLPQPAQAADKIENAVVKVFTTMRGPDLTRPWSKGAPREGTGSGVVIEGRRILTNAHVVMHAGQVQVQGSQSGEKVSATVEAIAPGIDLAVLKLEDESFFDSRPPIKRATQLPAVKDAVMAYGFPTGGNSLAITKGIVSRIEFVGYNFPTSGLRIQIDAAINPGNSGGPALSGDTMIGLAFARLGMGDNIGYIIPNEEIELFLADVADGRYDGKPGLFVGMQALENAALRAYLKVPKGATGVLVSEPSTAADNPFKRWDVLTRIGDKAIDNEGLIKLNDNLRLRFTYLVQQLARGGTVPIQVLRDGRAVDLKVPVRAAPDLLVPISSGAYPPYFIYGPLVFTTASADRIGSLGMSPSQMTGFSRSSSPLITRLMDRPDFPGQQLVMVTSPLLTHKLARGYGNPLLRVLRAVNDTPVRNLAHMVELLRDAQSEFVVLQFFGEGQDTIVLPRAEVAEATEAILTDNGIRAQASPELLRVWNAKP
jgi:S1-C subfamily serine protease